MAWADAVASAVKGKNINESELKNARRPQSGKTFQKVL
jgi:hypothetical protein